MRRVSWYTVLVSMVQTTNPSYKLKVSLDCATISDLLSTLPMPLTFPAGHGLFVQVQLVLPRPSKVINK